MPCSRRNAAYAGTPAAVRRNSSSIAGSGSPPARSVSSRSRSVATTRGTVTIAPSLPPAGRGRLGREQRDQVVDRDRLDQVVVEAGRLGAPAIRVLAVAGDRDQPQRAAALGPQPAGELVAVHHR